MCICKLACYICRHHLLLVQVSIRSTRGMVWCFQSIKIYFCHESRLHVGYTTPELKFGTRCNVLSRGPRQPTAHNLTFIPASTPSDVTTSTSSSTVRITHSAPSSLESHLSSSHWRSSFRAFKRPKTWLVSCGPTLPSALKQAVPTTEPKVRLRFPCAWSPPGNGAKTDP